MCDIADHVLRGANWQNPNPNDHMPDDGLLVGKPMRLHRPEEILGTVAPP